MKQYGSYTTLEQARELMRIVPVTSGDMSYVKTMMSGWQPQLGLDVAVRHNLYSFRAGYVMPCWSLAALYALLPKSVCLFRDEEGRFFCAYRRKRGEVASGAHVNPVNACYELIMKQHNCLTEKEEETKNN